MKWTNSRCVCTNSYGVFSWLIKQTFLLLKCKALEDELQFHRFVYDLQISYIKALFESVRHVLTYCFNCLSELIWHVKTHTKFFWFWHTKIGSLFHCNTGVDTNTLNSPFKRWYVYPYKVMMPPIPSWGFPPPLTPFLHIIIDLYLNTQSIACYTKMYLYFLCVCVPM